MTATMHLFSGPPGAGKTSVIAALAPHFTICPEPAREVLGAERARGGRGTGEQDPALFVSLMHARALEAYAHLSAEPGAVLFDRGLPDLLAYLGSYSLENDAIHRDCRQFRYSSRVFWFAHWPDIYVCDDERRATPAQAAAFGTLLEDAYRGLGYELVLVPEGPVSTRADFVAAELGLEGR